MSLASLELESFPNGNAETMSQVAGNFRQCKARWVLRGFQDKQKDEQQKDSPAASWPGLRMACQAAANSHWDVIHKDLGTAFLQGESNDES